MNPIENLSDILAPLLHTENLLIEQRIHRLLAELLIVDTHSNLKSLFEELFFLFNEFSNAHFYCLIEEGRIKKLLELTPHFSDEQRKLALLLAKKHLKWALTTEENHAHSHYRSAIDYSASVLKMGEGNEAVSREAHLFISQLFIQLFTHFNPPSSQLSPGSWKNALVDAMKSGDPDRFCLLLERIEGLRRFCNCELDKSLLGPFLKTFYEESLQFSPYIKSETREVYKTAYAKTVLNTKIPLKVNSSSLTEGYFHSFQAYRKAFTGLNNSESLREQQHALFIHFKRFFEGLVSDIFVILGPPPCSFDLRAMGSLAREEPCPFSDLEFMILIKNDEEISYAYFKTFCQILHYQTRLFGEVNDQLFTFTALSTQKGFHIDIGGDPLLNKSLIGTPIKMAQLQNSPETDIKSVENTLLKTASLFTTDAMLYTAYQKALNSFLEVEREDLILFRQWRAIEFIRVRVQDFQDFWAFSKIKSPIKNLKAGYLESLNHLVADIALFCGIPALNTLDIINEFQQRGIFSPQSCFLLEEASATIYKIRCRLHLLYGEQKEEATLPQIVLPGYQTLYPEEVENLDRIYCTVLKPLYEAVAKSVAPQKSLLEVKNQLIQLFSHFSFDPMVQTIWQLTTPVPPKERPVKVSHESFFHSRYLKSDIAQQVLDPSGHIKKSYENCAHAVTALPAFHLHLKEKPTHPLMEYAIHRLMYWIATPLIHTPLTPPTQLLRFDLEVKDQKIMFPVLLSQTVPGQTLRGVSLDWKNFSTSQQEQWSWMFLCSLLARPGDGRHSNYILSEDSRISCVDNDIAFVDPIIKNALGWKTVYFRSVLFFLFEKAPLSKAVLEAFVKLDVDKTLHCWLDELIEREKQYSSLFDEQELHRLYTEDENNRFKPTILFREGTLITLHLQFIRLQNFFKKALEENQTVFSLDLLKRLVCLRQDMMSEEIVGRYIYDTYKKALQKKPHERFNFVTSQTQEKSLTSKQSDTVTLGKIPSWEEIQHHKRYNLEKAREELFCTLLSNTNAVFIGNIPKKGKYLRASFRGMDEVRQTLVLKALTFLQQPEENSITLQSSSILTSATLKPLLHEKIIYLDLSGCSSIRDSTVQTLSQSSPLIEELRLIQCKALKAIGGVSLGVTSTFLFLKKLYLDECENLQAVYLNAPKLKSLSTKRCYKLNTYHFPHFAFIFTMNISDCPTYSKILESLADILKIKGTSIKDLVNKAREDLSVLVENNDFLTSQTGIFSIFTEALKVNTTLTSLNLSYDKVRNINLLADALEVNSTLTSLILHINHLNDITPLCQSLKVNSTLTSLDLSNNHISDVRALAKALEVNTSLKSLNLHSNEILTIKSLAKALKMNSALTSLNLGSNQITEFAFLAEALKENITLTALVLSANQMTDITLFAEALEVNSTLTSANLSSNPLKDLAPLMKALLSNKTLTTLNLSESGLSRDDFQTINKVLGINKKLSEG